MPVATCAERLLRYFAAATEFLGERVPFDRASALGYELLAVSESLEWQEVTFLLDDLAAQLLVVVDYALGDMGQATVSVAGYERLRDLDAKGPLVTQGFVAMWFDDSMNQAFDQGLAQGILDAGYTPLRIDKKQHNNRIDDEMIAEIRRSRFLVADFTHGEKGARGGVYYEAGFAQGLGLPVIFTVREDMLQHVHFDTRQYPHVTWTTPDDLRNQLATRISATIGDGPLKRGLATRPSVLS